MINVESSKLGQLAIHRVGNKHNDESVFVSEEPAELTDELKELLEGYFLKPFVKLTEKQEFVHEVELSYNVLKGIAESTFANEELFFEDSAKIVKHLYDQSNHPHIKSGDLFVAYFDEMYLDGELMNAIGVFKSERKDSFLQVSENETKLKLITEEGISIKKLDKGALILNSSEKGLIVLTVDNNNYDASYWKKDFLSVDIIKDDNYETKAYMDLCKSFAKDVIGNNETKKEEIDFVNQSVKYFEENDHVETQEFNDVLFDGVEELKEDFKDYKKAYESEYEVEIADSFNISAPVLQREKKSIANTIKLDTNIQLKMNFNDADALHQFVEQGYDQQKGMHYYKVFYNRELK
jgi:hypothetical protein